MQQKIYFLITCYSFYFAIFGRKSFNNIHVSEKKCIFVIKKTESREKIIELLLLEI